MSHRLTLTVDDATHRELLAAAQLRGTRPMTLAAAMLTDALLHASSATNSAPPSPHRHVADAREEDEPRAMWLQLDRGPEWRNRLWDALDQLRNSYPDIAHALRDGWHHDRFTRDGLLALTVWRTQLDTGNLPDPRMELQWLAALREFRRLLDEHHRQPNPRNPVMRPADW